jgi:hypothetical protein
MNYTIGISQFKLRCLEIIKKLQADHQTIIMTKKDKPIAEAVSLDNKKVSLFGMLKGKAEIKGDLIASIDEKWDAQL